MLSNSIVMEHILLDVLNYLYEFAITEFLFISLPLFSS